MSNVLIGIIGVILFIGLALAGALFLGPRFQESTQNSKVSAVTASIKQVVDASNLYALNEGQLPANSTAGFDSLVSKGYLKSAMANPVTGQRYFLSGTPTVPNEVRMVYTMLGDDASAKTMCLMIQKDGGGPAAEVETPTYPVSATYRSKGCFANRSYSPDLIYSYMAYQML